jgi:flagellar biosynthesis/type III secretory pathway protein FliH
MASCTQGIEQMLIGQLPNLRDTQSGKELIAIGKQEGREEGIQQGLEQGLEQGRKQGELIGQIRVLQEVLGLEQSEPVVLAVESVESLTAQLRELRLQYRKG